MLWTGVVILQALSVLSEPTRSEYLSPIIERLYRAQDYNRDEENIPQITFDRPDYEAEVEPPDYELPTSYFYITHEAERPGGRDCLKCLAQLFRSPSFVDPCDCLPCSVKMTSTNFSVPRDLFRYYQQFTCDTQKTTSDHFPENSRPFRNDKNRYVKFVEEYLDKEPEKSKQSKEIAPTAQSYDTDEEGRTRNYKIEIKMENGDNLGPTLQPQLGILFRKLDNDTEREVPPRRPVRKKVRKVLVNPGESRRSEKEGDGDVTKGNASRGESPAPSNELNRHRAKQNVRRVLNEILSKMEKINKSSQIHKLSEVPSDVPTRRAGSVSKAKEDKKRSGLGKYRNPYQRPAYQVVKTKGKRKGNQRMGNTVHDHGGHKTKHAPTSGKPQKRKLNKKANHVKRGQKQTERTEKLKKNKSRKEDASKKFADGGKRTSKKDRPKTPWRDPTVRDWAGYDSGEVFDYDRYDDHEMNILRSKSNPIKWETYDDNDGKKTGLPTSGQTINTEGGSINHGLEGEVNEIEGSGESVGDEEAEGGGEALAGEGGQESDEEEQPEDGARGREGLGGEQGDEGEANAEEAEDEKQNEDGDGEQTEDGDGEQTEDGEGEQTEDGEGEQTEDGEGEQTEDGEGEQTEDGEGEQTEDGEGEQTEDGEGEQTEDGEGEQTKDGEGEQTKDGGLESEPGTGGENGEVADGGEKEGTGGTATVEAVAGKGAESGDGEDEEEEREDEEGKEEEEREDEEEEKEEEEREDEEEEKEEEKEDEEEEEKEDEEEEEEEEREDEEEEKEEEKEDEEEEEKEDEEEEEEEEREDEEEEKEEEDEEEEREDEEGEEEEEKEDEEGDHKGRKNGLETHSPEGTTPSSKQINKEETKNTPGEDDSGQQGTTPLEQKRVKPGNTSAGITPSTTIKLHSLSIVTNIGKTASVKNQAISGSSEDTDFTRYDDNRTDHEVAVSHKRLGALTKNGTELKATKEPGTFSETSTEKSPEVPMTSSRKTSKRNTVSRVTTERAPSPVYGDRLTMSLPKKNPSKAANTEGPTTSEPEISDHTSKLKKSTYFTQTLEGRDASDTTWAPIYLLPDRAGDSRKYSRPPDEVIGFRIMEGEDLKSVGETGRKRSTMDYLPSSTEPSFWGGVRDGETVDEGEGSEYANSPKAKPTSNDPATLRELGNVSDEKPKFVLEFDEGPGKKLNDPAINIRLNIYSDNDPESVYRFLSKLIPRSAGHERHPPSGQSPSQKYRVEPNLSFGNDKYKFLFPPRRRHQD